MKIAKMANDHCCVPLSNNRDFKIVHDGRLGRLDECHVRQNPRDI